MFYATAVVTNSKLELTSRSTARAILVISTFTSGTDVINEYMFKYLTCISYHMFICLTVLYTHSLYCTDMNLNVP